MKEQVTEKFQDKKFLTLDNAARLSRGKSGKSRKVGGGQEKRVINRVVAKNGGDGFRWREILDLYAGYGFSAWVFSANAEKLVLIERHKETFELLKNNPVSNWDGTPCLKISEMTNVEFHNQDNIAFLKEMISKKVPPPELVDLDPFGGCDEQLCLVLDWMEDGAILVTDGRIEGLYRNSFIVRRHFPELNGKYTGKSAIKCPEEFLIPRMQKFAKDRNKIIRVVHYYAHPNSSRYVIELGKFHFSTAAMAEFHRRPKFIDWFDNVDIQNEGWIQHLASEDAIAVGQGNKLKGNG